LWRSTPRNPSALDAFAREQLQHCTTLQYTAIKAAVIHSNILQYTVTNDDFSCEQLQHCNMLQLSTTLCYSLQIIATHCKSLQHAVTHCHDPSALDAFLHLCRRGRGGAGGSSEHLGEGTAHVGVAVRGVDVEGEGSVGIQDEGSVWVCVWG